MKDIVERILASLVGLRVWEIRRDADILLVQLGDRLELDGRTVGSFTLQIACAWRVAGPTSILAASGDLFTPADPEADLASFDWDVPGASWWDVRMGEVMRLLEQVVAISTFMADSYGGVRLVCTGGLELEIFPNSSASPHIETEFWRLVRGGQSDDYVMVGTAGIELVQPT